MGTKIEDGRIVTHTFNSYSGKKTVSTRLIYKDLQGNEYFEFVNLADVPQTRMVWAARSVRHFEMNLTRSSLNSLMKRLIQTPGDSAKNAIAAEVMDRTNFCAEFETSLEIAFPYFLLNEEKPNTFDFQIQSQKKQLWLEDSESCAFFLSGVFQFIEPYSQLSREDFLTYIYDRKMNRPVKTKSEQKPQQQKKNSIRYAKIKKPTRSSQKASSSQTTTPLKPKN